MPGWTEGLFLSAELVTLLGGFVASVVGFIRIMSAMWRHPAQGPAFFKRTLLGIAAYLASGAFIILFLIALTDGKPCPDAFSIPAVGLVLLWIALSAVWLIRALPKDPHKPPPAWLVKPFGWLDRLVIAAMVICLVLALAARTGCG